MYTSCVPKYKHWKEFPGEDAFKFIKFGHSFSHFEMNELHSRSHKWRAAAFFNLLKSTDWFSKATLQIQQTVNRQRKQNYF